MAFVAANQRKLGALLCRALGIDPKDVRRITIDVGMDGPMTVSVQRAQDVGALNSGALVDAVARLREEPAFKADELPGFVLQSYLMSLGWCFEQNPADLHEWKCTKRVGQRAYGVICNRAAVVEYARLCEETSFRNATPIAEGEAYHRFMSVDPASGKDFSAGVVVPRLETGYLVVAGPCLRGPEPSEVATKCLCKSLLNGHEAGCPLASNP